MTKQPDCSKMKTNDPLVCSPNSDERIFKKVTAYIRTAPINAYHQESIRRDIVRMLLDAQSMGKRQEDVIGADYRAFCDSVIAEVPPLTRRERLLIGLRGALLTAYFLIIYWLIL